MNMTKIKNTISAKPGEAGEDAWKRLFDCVEGTVILPLPEGRELLRLAQLDHEKNY
ncbi:hypothetical protein KKD52_10765 [Myxococcota bacterium]|nr:hypothetical protein [Myxococcota bacterium]MBU1510833.1 hypothetical protein [Myxococcota bacterium]